MTLPDTPVGRQVAWLLASTGPDACTEDDVREHFAPSFLERVPVDAVLALLAEQAWMATAEIRIERSSEHELALALSVDGQIRAMLGARVEAAEPHRIEGAGIRPPGASWDEAIDSATALDVPFDAAVQRSFGDVAAELSPGGIVVGISQRGERSVFSFGADGALRYEIGSITKTFTGLLLAEMVSRGEVKEDDPVRVYLPDGVRAPSSGDREVTLIDLATQSSGLPRLPPNFSEGSDPTDPYAHIDAGRLYEELAATTLESAPGTKSSYSNFGFGLLGHTLSLAAGKPFADLVVERICTPLRMTRTSFSSGGDDVAQGYANGEPVKHWTGEIIQGAGCGLESTIDDMLTYAEANLDPSETPIADALREAHRVRLEHSNRARQALGWLHYRMQDGTFALFHNGGTAGFSSSLVAHQPTKTAIVALCNGGGGVSLDSPVFGLVASLLATAHQSAGTAPVSGSASTS